MAWAACQIYSGSQDGTVRVFDSKSAQVLCLLALACRGQYEQLFTQSMEVPIGAEVDSLLLVKPYLFVGCHAGQDGRIRVYNTSGAAPPQDLTGHQVTYVYSMALKHQPYTTTQ